MGAALLGGLLAGRGADPSTLAVVRGPGRAAPPAGRAVPRRRRHRRASRRAPRAVIAVKPPDVPGRGRGGGRRRCRAACCRSPPACRSPRSRPRPAPVVAVVRAMPNTPALVGAGCVGDRRRSVGRRGRPARGPRASSAPSASSSASPSSHLDAVTALTGSGPAYLFLVAEALDRRRGGGRAAPAAGVDAHHAAVRRFVGAARRARRPGRAAGDGHVAGRHDGGRAAGARGPRRALGAAPRRWPRRPRAAPSWARETRSDARVNYATVFRT